MTEVSKDIGPLEKYYCNDPGGYGPLSILEMPNLPIQVNIQ